MKIRYYLRGLGLGILVTAIFFMISGKTSQTMSDEMIKARAKELGMSESVVLSELPVKDETVPETNEVLEEDTTEENAIEENTIEENATEENTIEEVIEEISEEVPETPETNEEVTVEAETSEEENTEPVIVAVNRGEGSDTVSRRLQEAGLVADAHEYDRYLMSNGYDKRIGVGEHSIPAGATWEDIAKILCNMR